MKLLSLISLGLFRSCSSKRYLVETLEGYLPDYNEVNNIVEKITIGDMVVYIMDYDQYPYHLLNNNNYITNIEEDQDVFLQNIEQFSFPFLQKSAQCLNLQENPVWNLDRVDQKMKHLDNRYFYHSSQGSNVNVFVVDTGIDVNHYGFTKPPKWGFNGADDVDTDCNGHGTHVAGTIAAKNYGIAKNANLIAVKVLNCKGGGTFSGILKGFEYSARVHRSSTTPSVVNMSLGGSRSSTLNRASAKLVSFGMHVIVAAGNSNQDACNFSPASESSVITVGATTQQDTLASFSNWGTCVNILAPGTNIKSLLPNDKTGSLQGTSMSSPHVAGVAALLLSENPNLSPKELYHSFENTCTKNTISGQLHNSPNCLLYSLA